MVIPFDRSESGRPVPHTWAGSRSDPTMRRHEPVVAAGTGDRPLRTVRPARSSTNRGTGTEPVVRLPLPETRISRRLKGRHVAPLSAAHTREGHASWGHAHPESPTRMLVSISTPRCRRSTGSRSRRGPPSVAGAGPIGHFGGTYLVPSGPDRILVASADGVGTKLKLAFAPRWRCARRSRPRHRQPLRQRHPRARCVAAVLPRLLCDRQARPDVAARVVGGMADACLENGMALIGGETAEMPGMYPARGIRPRRDSSSAVSNRTGSSMVPRSAGRRGDRLPEHRAPHQRLQPGAPDRGAHRRP